MPLFRRHNVRVDSKEMRTPEYSVQFPYLPLKKNKKSHQGSSNSFGTGAYLPPPVTTATFPARASGRKGEDDDAVDAMVQFIATRR
jgi:hypothetical protein